MTVYIHCPELNRTAGEPTVMLYSQRYSHGRDLVAYIQPGRRVEADAVAAWLRERSVERVALARYGVNWAANPPCAVEGGLLYGLSQRGVEVVVEPAEMRQILASPISDGAVRRFWEETLARVEGREAGERRKSSLAALPDRPSSHGRLLEKR